MTTSKKAKTVLCVISYCKDHTTITVFAFLDLRIGMVDEISDEFGDYHIKFMHPQGPLKQFRWPAKEDTCWVGEESILCQISAPSLTSSSSSMKYIITGTDEENIAKIYPQWMTSDR